MVLYIVNVSVKREKSKEWLEWMQNVHIPDVLSTGYFTKAEMFNIILPATHHDNYSYSVQYESETYEKFMKYRVKESDRLRKDHEDKFGEYITSERYVMEKR